MMSQVQFGNVHTPAPDTALTHLDVAEHLHRRKGVRVAAALPQDGPFVYTGKHRDEYLSIQNARAFADDTLATVQDSYEAFARLNDAQPQVLGAQKALLSNYVGGLKSLTRDFQLALTSQVADLNSRAKLFPAARKLDVVA